MTSPAQAQSTRSTFNPLTTDPQLIRALQTAVCGVLQTLAPTTSVKLEEPFTKRADTVLDSEIGAKLEIRSKTFDGCMVLNFPTGAYLSLVEQLHGQLYSAITEANDDAAAELLNMIRAGIRKLITDYIIEKNAPESLRGPTTQKMLRGYQCVVAIPFSAFNSKFHLELGVTYR